MAKVVAAASVEPTERKRSSRIATKQSELDAVKQKEAATARLLSGNRRGADRSRTGPASLAHLTDHEKRELRLREREEQKLERQNSEILAAVTAAEEENQQQETEAEPVQDEAEIPEQEDIPIEQTKDEDSKQEDLEVEIEVPTKPVSPLFEM